MKVRGPPAANGRAPFFHYEFFAGGLSLADGIGHEAVVVIVIVVDDNDIDLRAGAAEEERSYN